jgi:hypothetical protein
VGFSEPLPQPFPGIRSQADRESAVSLAEGISQELHLLLAEVYRGRLAFEGQVGEVEQGLGSSQGGLRLGHAAAREGEVIRVSEPQRKLSSRSVESIYSAVEVQVQGCRRQRAALINSMASVRTLMPAEDRLDEPQEARILHVAAEVLHHAVDPHRVERPRDVVGRQDMTILGLDGPLEGQQGRPAASAGSESVGTVQVVPLAEGRDGL